MVSLCVLLLLVVQGTHALTITVKYEDLGGAIPPMHKLHQLVEAKGDASGGAIPPMHKLHQLVEAKVDPSGGAIPPMQNLTSSCSCDKLLLSSLGPAAIFQPKVMGIYTRSWTSYNKQPSYRQNYGADYRLYRFSLGWLVGHKRGANTGYVYNPDTSQTCPYLIQSGWLYYNSVHGVWYPDTTLVLRCIQRTEE
eukprot:GFUD01069195.1.p1 GENE.GFUD01069195.1~~GFUD01069195.1.p1  ORF type:complete len:194 (-),score=51.80 GFUD01069195.1:122-703(-)